MLRNAFTGVRPIFYVKESSCEKMELGTCFPMFDLLGSYPQKKKIKIYLEKASTVCLLDSQSVGLLLSVKQANIINHLQTD